MSEKGFTLIELIIVIAIIGLLAGVSIPAYVNIVDDAHAANMDGVESAMRSAVLLYASEGYVEDGTLEYPAANFVTIANMIESGFINDWTDLGGGVWQYDPTGGNLTYTQTGGGTGYSVTKSYSGGGGGGDNDSEVSNNNNNNGNNGNHGNNGNNRNNGNNNRGGNGRGGR